MLVSLLRVIIDLVSYSYISKAGAEKLKLISHLLS